MIPVELILLALSPVFVGFIGWEWYRAHRAGNGLYRWQDTLANAVLALLFLGVVCTGRVKPERAADCGDARRKPVAYEPSSFLWHF